MKTTILTLTILSLFSGCGRNTPVAPASEQTQVGVPTAVPAPRVITPSPTPTETPTYGEEPGVGLPPGCREEYLDCLVDLDRDCEHEKDPNKCWDHGQKKCDSRSKDCSKRAN